MSRRRTGILGGMFDPIHNGHLDAAAAAERALGLTEMLVIPSNIPPHRPQPVASSHHRFAMVAMAVAGRPGWCAVDIEVGDPAPSFTSDTLQRLHAVGYHASELFFITGVDAFIEIATWRNYPAVLDLAHFAVIARSGLAIAELPARLPALASRMSRPGSAMLGAAPGIFLIDAVTADVSSTAIRRARQEQQSLAGMIPPSVQQHIEQHGLYQQSMPDAGGHNGLLGVAAGGLHGED
jgi:nicotinate-nucleotide adenylyltransferase